MIFENGKLILGNTLKLTPTYAGYTPDDGYTLTLKIQGANSISIDSTTVDGGHQLYATPATTTGWVAGFHGYVVIATDGTDEYSMEDGQVELELRADLDISTDKRSHSQIVLDNIRTVIQGKASTDVMSYTIKGRQLQRYSFDELMKLEREYSRRVKLESGQAKPIRFIRTTLSV